MSRMARRFTFEERAFAAWQGAYKNGTATPNQIAEIADWLLSEYERLQSKRSR